MASGQEPPGYHSSWQNGSGVTAKSTACREHALLIHTIWLMRCVDSLDGANLASAEHLCRRILQIQRAVRRNPRAPDYEGLEGFTEHMVDGAMGVPTADFDRHIAELQPVIQRAISRLSTLAQPAHW